MNHLPSRSPRPPAVLSLSLSPSFTSHLEQWCQRNKLLTLRARNSSEALVATQTAEVAVALIEHHGTADDDRIDLGRVLRQRFGVPFVLLGDRLGTATIVAAMRAGATDVIDIPVAWPTLLAVLSRAIQRPRRRHQLAGVSVNLQTDESPIEFRSTAERWAHLVWSARDATADLRTVGLWARWAGVSKSTLEELCRVCGVTARDSRDLARLLRAAIRSQSGETALRDELAVADDRTLRSLFRRAGLSVRVDHMCMSTFFDTQRLISRSSHCLWELQHLVLSTSAPKLIPGYGTKTAETRQNK